MNLSPNILARAGISAAIFAVAVALGTTLVVAQTNSTVNGNINARPGDANRDGKVDISDVVYLARALPRQKPTFRAGTSSLIDPCLASADADGNSQVGVPDLMYLVSYLFGGGAAPKRSYLSCTSAVPGPKLFIRADANGDLQGNESDAKFVEASLQAGAPARPCDDSADANDDGAVTLADAAYIRQQIAKQVPPKPPFGEPFTDPTADRISCARYPGR